MTEDQGFPPAAVQHRYWRAQDRILLAMNGTTPDDGDEVIGLIVSPTVATVLCSEHNKLLERRMKEEGLGDGKR